MLRKPLAGTLVFAGVHLLAFFGALFVSMASLHYLYDPGWSPSMVHRAADTISSLLGFPAIWIWTHYRLGPVVPDIFEWLFLLANSLLWGAFLRLFWCARRDSNLRPPV